MYRYVVPILLAGCASGPQFPDATPLAVEECRQEAAALTELDPWAVRDDSRSTGEGGGVIEEARTAAAEAQRTGLVSWPEEVLVYRCLASRGEPLTTEQARELADWERRLEEQEPR
jgi:hypothetical protein